MLKRFSIYSFFNAPIAQKSTLKEKNSKIMKYIILSCNYTDFFYTIAKLCDIFPFLTVGYIKKGEKCLFKGVFLPFKIVVWGASYEIFLIFLFSSLG